MNKKAEKFQAMLDENKITAFGKEELKDDFHTVAYRSQLEVEKQLLPLIVLVDDSIYAIVRVFVATKVVTDGNKEKISAYLNEFNKKFKVFKYYISDEGDLVLDSCLPASDDNFDPNLVRAVIEVILGHLQENYKEIMKEVWAK